MLQIQPTRAIALLAALTIALIALGVSVLLWEMRKRDLESARLQTFSLAHMLREQTARVFEGADQALRGVQDRMQTPYGAALAQEGDEVRLLLGARLLGAPHAEILAIADEHGRIVNTSHGREAAVRSIRETAHFQAFAQGAADEVRLSGPHRAGPGEWTLDMARPLADAKGRFRGVVVLTLKVPRLEGFNSSLQLEHPRSLGLYLADGTLVASAPPRESLVGERLPEVGPGELQVEGSQVRMHSHVSGDGGRHQFAFARVGSLPLLVSVASDEESALALWRERSFSVALGGFVVCLFVVSAAIALAGELEREARLERALRDARDRYHRTVDSVLDAIVGVDENMRIILFNPAAERMFGWTAAEAVGAPLERLLPERARGWHGHYVREFVRSGSPSRGMAPQVETTALRADGTEFPVESTISHTTVDGKPQVTAVVRDVTERQRAERELRDMNRQLRNLSASLQDVREEERARIAAELHDELGQQLTGLKLGLSWLGGRVKEGRPPTAAEIDGMRHELDAAITSVRRIATELRPRVLDDRTLDEALAWLASDFAGRGGLEVELDVPAAAGISDNALATAVYRIVQESLTNVVRHASARHVAISFVHEGDGLLLRVRDDGAGMHPGAPGGIGLVSMRERAWALKGTLKVTSAPGEGTAIEVRLPAAAAVPQQAAEEFA